MDVVVAVDADGKVVATVTVNPDAPILVSGVEPPEGGSVHRISVPSNVDRRSAAEWHEHLERELST